MPEINGQNLATVAHVTTLAQRVKSELDSLDTRNFGDVSIANGQIKFFAKSGDSTPLKSIDLPEEIFLDQTQTAFVQSFSFSAATYPGATNPNLDGKPVLVLAVKGDKTTNPTLSFSFINLETLIVTYSAGNGININNNTIAAKISSASGNLLTADANGLYIGDTGKGLSTEDYSSAEKTKLAGIEDNAQENDIEIIKVDNVSIPPANKIVNIDLSGKVDKVTTATSGNIIIFGSGGALVDSGVAIESDANVANAINSIFGGSGS